MGSTNPTLPPIRACLFDMDGLLIDSEDKYTICTNAILQKYDRPLLPWSIKAQMQGRPGGAAGSIFKDWAQLPISNEQYYSELVTLQKEHFPQVKTLPGVERLLEDLNGATTLATKGKEGERLHIALATSSHEANFKLKTGHLEGFFGVFEQTRRVLGDDVRIAPGRGKPLPDIWLLALKMVNESLKPGEKEVLPEECLVFEDSVPGVESGRRAGMQVVWCPHPGLLEEYRGREKEVLAGRTGEAGMVDLHQVGEVDDGWAELVGSLEGFDYGKYGIVV